MKRLTICTFLFLAAVAAFAQGVPSPATPRIMIDSAGTLMDSSNPMPVDAVVTVGSITVSTGAPPDVNQTTALSVSSTSTSTVALANRQDITLIYPTENGTATVWINAGGSVATPGMGIPLYPGGFWSRDADTAVPVAVVCTSSVSITVHQGGF